MSAKPSKKSARKDPAPPAPRAAETTPAAAPATDAGVPAAAAPSWLDSTDPRKRTIGKIVLAGVWVYVGALWLLALDQTFHWGVFGPKIPPLP